MGIRHRRIIAYLGGALATLAVTGCVDGEIKGKGYVAMLEDPGETAAEGVPAPAPTSTATPSPTPTNPPPGALPGLGTLDPNCMSSSSYDTCIVLKNPVAQRKAALSPRLSPASNLDAVLIYGVKLTDLDTTGNLQNSSFRIIPGGTRTRVTRNSGGNWKYPFSTNCSGTTCTADPNRNIGQLMAYFWLNYQNNYMEAATGKFYARNKNIRVTTYQSNLNNAYWDGAGNIVMGDGGSANGPEFAMSAEIYLHEAGHANLTYAAPGTAGGLGNCPSVRGCLGGIHEGQADYHAAIIFPESGVPVGEVIANSINGFTECGLSRTIGANRNTTAQQAYDACSTKGEVHLMGRIYASVWWEVRMKSGNNPREVDQLFTEHLKTLQASDTFLTALGKIRSTDQALFGAKYGQQFTEEFARRGL